MKNKKIIHRAPYRGKACSAEIDYPLPPKWIVGIFIGMCIFGAAFALGVMAGSMSIAEAGIAAMDGAVMLP